VPVPSKFPASLKSLKESKRLGPQRTEETGVRPRPVLPHASFPARLGDGGLIVHCPGARTGAIRRLLMSTSSAMGVHARQLGCLQPAVAAYKGRCAEKPAAAGCMRAGARRGRPRSGRWRWTTTPKRGAWASRRPAAAWKPMCCRRGAWRSACSGPPRALRRWGRCAMAFPPHSRSPPPRCCCCLSTGRRALHALFSRVCPAAALLSLWASGAC
jgi:hypothetical protein